MTLRYTLGCLAKKFYDAIPISTKLKISISHRLFATCPFIFRSTRPYKDWVVAGNHDTRTWKWNLRKDLTRASAVSSANEQYLNQLFAQAKGSNEYSSHYLEYDPENLAPLEPAVKLIAFYLPQFHPFKENDEWWGKGFTEWTNVSKAVPQFVGHYQPHLPGELGFYDLRIPEIMHRQIELAKHYSIYGWCFHFYWFGGKRLLETPLNQFLQTQTMDMPFCLCWANENWTRRWDGSEHEILMAQEHSPEDDLALIKEFEISFRDPRYIRINGRPLLIVYRASILPDAIETTKRWREYCVSAGLGDPFLVAAQSFDITDPTIFGFDAAVEFPPHHYTWHTLNQELEIVNPEYEGYIFDYRDLADQYCARPKQSYPVFKTVSPGWDNEARKPGKGHSFHNFSLSKYSEWLGNACKATISDNSIEPLVFINAWNEWGEGAHLEPDRKYGYGYLEATRNAVAKIAPITRPRRIVIVSHDAFTAGAQYLVGNLSKEIATTLKIPVDIVTLGKGDLLGFFAESATVHDISDLAPESPAVKSLLEKLFIKGATSAIVNTTASGCLVKMLKDIGYNVISLVHELPGTIKKGKLTDQANSIAAYSDLVVFAAKHVADEFARCAPNLPSAKIRIRPQGSYKRNKLPRAHRDSTKRELRLVLGIPFVSKIVLGVGYGDHRKGVDLFVAAGISLLKKGYDIHFVWVGALENGAFAEQIKEKVKSSFPQNFHFTEHEPNTDIYYMGADVFALTSREDPFPTVVLEALEVGLPVVAFEGAGGFIELLSRGCGITAPAYNTIQYAQCIETLLSNNTLANEIGERGIQIISNEFGFTEYATYLVSLCDKPKSVSVIIPNYNYSHHLKERLYSITRQTYPVHEIIILDDCSTDESLKIIEDLQKSFPSIKLFTNEHNSGSVFRQWNKGVQLATGDLIWIAEADDLAETIFLETVSRPFSDPAVVLSYCQSKQLDATGHITEDNYLPYTSEINSQKWSCSYVEDGVTEIVFSLSVKNTLPNVSAALFRTDTLKSILHRNLETISSMKIAGDWLTYCLILEHGKIAYNYLSLNLHRRHQNSVTHSEACERHLQEVIEVQRILQNKHQIPAQIKAQATDYAKRLYFQFGLDKSLDGADFQEFLIKMNWS